MKYLFLTFILVIACSSNNNPVSNIDKYVYEGNLSYSGTTTVNIPVNMDSSSVNVYIGENDNWIQAYVYLPSTSISSDILISYVIENNIITILTTIKTGKYRIVILK